MNQEIDLGKVKSAATAFYTNADFNCAETVLRVIKDTFKPEIPDDVVKMASGFGGGVGSTGGICGALTGSIMAMDLCLGRSQPKAKTDAPQMARELYDYFRANFSAVNCCELTAGYRMNSPERRVRCSTWVIGMTEATACIIAREMGLAIKE